MAGSLSLYGRFWLLGLGLTPDATPALTELWVALTRTVPAEGDDGTTISEPDNGSYARVSYPVGSDFWTSSGYGTFLNSQDIPWPDISEDWPVLLGWALCTAPDGGSTLAVGRLTAPLQPVDGDTLLVPAFTVSLSALGQVG